MDPGRLLFCLLCLLIGSRWSEQRALPTPRACEDSLHFLDEALRCDTGQPAYMLDEASGCPSRRVCLTNEDFANCPTLVHTNCTSSHYVPLVQFQSGLCPRKTCVPASCMNSLCHRKDPKLFAQAFFDKGCPHLRCEACRSEEDLINEGCAEGEFLIVSTDWEGCPRKTCSREIPSQLETPKSTPSPVCPPLILCAEGMRHVYWHDPKDQCLFRLCLLVDAAKFSLNLTQPIQLDSCDKLEQCPDGQTGTTVTDKQSGCPRRICKDSSGPSCPPMVTCQPGEQLINWTEQHSGCDVGKCVVFATDDSAITVTAGAPSWSIDLGWTNTPNTGASTVEPGSSTTAEQKAQSWSVELGWTDAVTTGSPATEQTTGTSAEERAASWSVDLGWLGSSTSGSSSEGSTTPTASSTASRGNSWSVELGWTAGPSATEKSTEKSANSWSLDLGWTDGLSTTESPTTETATGSSGKERATSWSVDLGWLGSSTSGSSPEGSMTPSASPSAASRANSWSVELGWTDGYTSGESALTTASSSANSWRIETGWEKKLSASGTAEVTTNSPKSSNSTTEGSVTPQEQREGATTGAGPVSWSVELGWELNSTATPPANLTSTPSSNEAKLWSLKLGWANASTSESSGEQKSANSTEQQATQASATPAVRDEWKVQLGWHKDQHSSTGEASLATGQPKSTRAMESWSIDSGWTEAPSTVMAATVAQQTTEQATSTTTSEGGNSWSIRLGWGVNNSGPAAAAGQSSSPEVAATAASASKSWRIETGWEKNLTAGNSAAPTSATDREGGAEKRTIELGWSSSQFNSTSSPEAGGAGRNATRPSNSNWTLQLGWKQRNSTTGEKPRQPIGENS